MILLSGLGRIHPYSFSSNLGSEHPLDLSSGSLERSYHLFWAFLLSLRLWEELRWSYVLASRPS